MKAQSKEFGQFQREFKKYQQMFGLNGYKVYYEEVPLDDCFAQILTNPGNMAVTVRLNSVPAPHGTQRHPRQSAKHEAIHLLLNKLSDLAAQRYVRQGEVSEAEEELVFKLEGLIP